jgi:hypothetical protein
MASGVNAYAIPYYYPLNSTAAGTTNAANAYEQLIALNEELQVPDATSASGTGAQTGAAADDTAALDSANLLNLNAQALTYLNGVNGLNGANDNTALAGITGTAALTGLTGQQQLQLTNILANNADQPFTQDTFTQIINALTAAGISPQQLTMQQVLLSYDPASLLIYALNAQNFAQAEGANNT